MKRLHLFVLGSLFLCGCAANLTFIDRSNGQEYNGKTGSTFGGEGHATAAIEGERYTGRWIYSASGGGYSLATANAYSGPYSASASSSAFTVSAHGNGLIELHDNSGSYLRCVYNFNTLSNKGIGACQRNDGRLYDLMIDR